jgi:hypothetical protein
MGGNAYEYQPYSRNDPKIKGTRIAIFKAVNIRRAFASIRLRS